MTAGLDLSGARVLVTGGSGFLGSHVVRVIEERGGRPIVVRSADYDLTNPQRVRDALTDTHPIYVVHLAAVVGGIGANRRHPARFFYENAVMGVHVIHESWQHGIEKMLVVGTVCSYPKFAPLPFKEADLWSGYPEETNAPYGLAKKMLIVQAQAYRAEYEFNCVVVVPTNLYGTGDNFDPETSHVIPAMVRKCLEAKACGTDEIVLWGSGTPTRDFLHVDDAAEAIVLALERYDGCDPLNLGSGRETSIAELASIVADVTEFRGRIIWDRSQPDGQPRRAVDSSAAAAAIGWSPRTDLADGIRAIVDRYADAMA